MTAAAAVDSALQQFGHRHGLDIGKQIRGFLGIPDWGQELSDAPCEALLPVRLVHFDTLDPSYPSVNECSRMRSI